MNISGFFIFLVVDVEGVLLAPFAVVVVPRDRPDECSLTLAGDCVLLFSDDERVGLRYEL